MSTARGAWGPDVEILSAHGLGRSYGAPSRIPFRVLPGILESGLWGELRRLPEAPTRALIADVGNDIAYGFLPAQILGWIEEAADRLLSHTRDVTLTDVPMQTVRSLSPASFLFFRTLLLPSSRVGRSVVFERVGEVNQGLAALAARKKLRLVHLKPEWYGFDPIHFRPACWRQAWRDILLGEASASPAARLSLYEWARLLALPPDRRQLFGLEQATPQAGRRLSRGGRLWLY